MQPVPRYDPGMEKGRGSEIVRIGGGQYFVLQNAEPISERYSFAEWEKGEAKLRNLRKAVETNNLSPADKALLKKHGL